MLACVLYRCKVILLRSKSPCMVACYTPAPHPAALDIPRHSPLTTAKAVPQQLYPPCWQDDLQKAGEEQGCQCHADTGKQTCPARCSQLGYCTAVTEACLAQAGSLYKAAKGTLKVPASCTRLLHGYFAALQARQLRIVLLYLPLLVDVANLHQCTCRTQ